MEQNRFRVAEVQKHIFKSRKERPILHHLLTMLTLTRHNCLPGAAVLHNHRQTLWEAFSAPKQKLLDEYRDWIHLVDLIQVDHLSEYSDEAVCFLLTAARLGLKEAQANRAAILLCHIRFKSRLDPSRRADVLSYKTKVQALEVEAQKRLVKAKERVKALKASLRA
jgi:hypothetical protein